ncbi:MAG: class II aldolase/adducin family protein [Actinomycetota bacterium]|nr:MAG: class II aldolase/adducin family protein [Actinomycetota bacterium]
MTLIADPPARSDFARSLSVRTPRLPGPPQFTSAADERLHRKQRLAAALRIFGRYGYDEGLAGHITARDPELTYHFWVNPLGRAFSRISVSDLILVDPAGRVVYGEAPVNQAAFAIHSAVHAARPDVVSAAHSHSIHGKALAALREPLEPLSQDACLLYERQAVVEFGGVALDAEEGRRIAAGLGSNRLALLANHGFLTVGGSVEEAAALFVIAERNAQVQLLAKAAGDVKPISHEVATYTRNQGESAGDFGWYLFAGLWEQIVHEQPDLLW